MLTVEATVEKLPNVMKFIDSKLEEISCAQKSQNQIRTAVEELFVNIAHYAYPGEIGLAEVRFKFIEKERAVEISFADKGIPYDPLKKTDPDISLSADERAIGGLGIYMAKKLMDDFRYEYKDSQNINTIYKRI
ncbi:ATP-binding protein [Butyrivibrio sp. X503]|nr:ATP-binding protein [Butyrivibrio sp. X503]